MYFTVDVALLFSVCSIRIAIHHSNQDTQDSDSVYVHGRLISSAKMYLQPAVGQESEVCRWKRVQISDSSFGGMALLNSKQPRQVVVTSGDCSLSRGNNITRRVLYNQRSPFVFPTSPGISRLKEMNFHRGQNWSKKNSLGKPSSFQDKTFFQSFFHLNPAEWQNVRLLQILFGNCYNHFFT